MYDDDAFETSRSPDPVERPVSVTTTTVAELDAQIVALRARVEILEGQVDEWKKRAFKSEARVEKVTAKAEKALAKAVAKARKQALEEAATGEPASAASTDDEAADDDAVVEDVAPADPRVEPVAHPHRPEQPDATWTVVRLRAAAKERGIEGYARLRKEQLLAALI